MAENTLRDTLNAFVPGRGEPALAEIQLGELLSRVISSLTPNETGLAPSSNVVTLAEDASVVFTVNATAGGTTGIKKLLKGAITGEGKVTPAAGECVWDGGKKILLATA